MDKIKEEEKKRMEDLTPKQDGKKIVLKKDASTKITRSKYTGITQARILTYTENLTLDKTDNTIFTITLGEDKDKFEEGVARIEIQKNGIVVDALVNIDVLITVMQQKYAKTITDIEVKERRKKQMIKYINFFKRFMDKFRT